MGKVIGIVNQKGGVGKTTTTVSLAAALALQGAKIIVVDFDPQANLTSGILSPTPETLEYTITEMMEDVLNRKPCTYNLAEKEGFRIIPSKIDLSAAEMTLQTVMSRETVLKRVLEPLRQEADVILIDCPPSLGILNINALTAADSVIVPVTPDYYAPKGLELLLNSITGVREALNPTLQIEGVLITKADKRGKFYKEGIDFIQNEIGKVCPVFETEIPVSVSSAQAPAEQMTIFAFDKRSPAARAYESLAKEIASRIPELATRQSHEQSERGE